MDGERSGDGRIIRAEGHVKPRVLAEIVEHIRKIFRLARDKAVAHAGREHQLCEGGYHFLAADPDRDALSLGKADVVAPFLVEACEQLVLGLSLDVQAENIARLDGLKVLAALLAAEAELMQHGGKGGIGRGHVGVDFDDVGPVALCKLLCACEQLGKRLAVVQVADRAAAAVHEAPADAGDLARHEGERALDFAVCAADGDGVPLPHGLLQTPETALGKIALRVGLDKGFVFGKRFVCDEFVHVGPRYTYIIIVSKTVCAGISLIIQSIIPHLPVVCKGYGIFFARLRHNSRKWRDDGAGRCDPGAFCGRGRSGGADGVRRRQLAHGLFSRRADLRRRHRGTGHPAAAGKSAGGDDAGASASGGDGRGLVRGRLACRGRGECGGKARERLLRGRVSGRSGGTLL